MVWYSHVLKNFPQFVAIYIVSGFDVIDRAKVDVLEEEGESEEEVVLLEATENKEHNSGGFGKTGNEKIQPPLEK